MGFDLNKVELIGTLGRDVDVRYHGADPIATLSVATTEKWKDASGEKKERTEWHSVKAFKYVAEDSVGLLKGERVFVEGVIRTEEWTGKDGEKKTAKIIIATRVEVIEKRRKGGQAAGAAPAAANNGGTKLPTGDAPKIPTGQAASAAAGSPEDDDLPY